MLGRSVSRWIILLLLLSATGCADTPDRSAAATRRAVPSVPRRGPRRVLLLGDSICLQYAPFVKKLLQNEIDVHTIPQNGLTTAFAVAHLSDWLGKGQWDVIHFNWGLHDLRATEDETVTTPLDAYQSNLRKLLTRMKKTGARLIWATTTPVPAGNPMQQPDTVVLYNRAALEVMREAAVDVDDLYAFAAPQLAKLQIPHNVHFTQEGSAALARQVAESIRSALHRPMQETRISAATSR